MPSAKPTKPPAHDAKAANNVWRKTLKPDLTEYAVFASESYLAFTAWTRALRDVVNANAIYLDDVAGNAARALQETDDLEARVAALEARPAARPFP